MQIRLEDRKGETVRVAEEIKSNESPPLAIWTDESGAVRYFIADRQEREGQSFCLVYLEVTGVLELSAAAKTKKKA